MVIAIKSLWKKFYHNNLITQFDKLMGAEDWVDKLYADSQQRMLPGFESEECKMERMRAGVTEKLVEYYRNRLKTCFNEVSRAVIMRNSKKGPLYALILASQQKLAVQKMHEIFNRDEKRTGTNCT